MLRTAPRFALPAALLLSISLPIQAHNGAVAIAVPVEGITVDGDLSDWPEGLAQYPIEMSAFGALMRDRDDLAASFRVGHGLRTGHLYVGVETVDQSTVVDAMHPDHWWTQDGCEVFLAASHSDAPHQYVLYGGSERWESDVTAAARRTGRRHTYEWRIPLEADGGIVGFDITIHDKDREEAYSRLAWGRRAHKHIIKGVGDLLLRPGPVGYLRGQVNWKMAEEGRRVGLVEIHSLTDESWHTTVRTGQRGDYQVELPPGEYSVAAGYRGAATDAVHVRVEAHDSTAVPPLAFEPPPIATRVPAGPGTSVIAGPGRTVQAGPGYRNQAFHIYGIADGLPAADVWSMHQSRDGSLWMAVADAGIVRYDGTHFASLTARDGLPSNRISEMAEDLEGNMWLATGQGLCRFDGRILTRFGTEDGMIGPDVWPLTVDSTGALWAGTAAGLTRYDGETFTHYTDEDLIQGVQSVLVEGDRVWFGMDSGVGCLQDGRVMVYDGADGIPQARVGTIVRDHNKDLWYWTQTPVGAVRYDGHAFTAYPPPDGPAKGADMAVDGSGVVWFATDGYGLWFYDGERFGQVGRDEGLPHPIVGSVLCDAHGNLWVGTQAGVALYRGDQLRVYSEANFPGGGSVSDIAETPNGAVWFGTWGSGVTKYDGKTFETFGATDGLGFDRVSAMLADRQGNVWLGGGDGEGIARYDGGRFVRYTSQDGLTPGSGISAIEKASDGAIWVAERRLGVLHMADPDAGFARIDTLPARAVGDMLRSSSGELWIASRFDVTAGLWSYGDGRLKKHDLSTGIRKSDWACALAEDPTGNLWIGTWGGGLARFDGSVFTHYALEVFPHMLINGMAADIKGRIWISTSGKGLWVFDGVVLQNLSKRDGLPSDDIGAVHCSSDGSVWTSAAGGLVRYRPGVSPPGAVIRDVVTDRRWGEVGEINLTALQDYLAIEYGLEDIGAIRGRTLFQHRLLGRDDRWQSSREQRVELEDLAIGSYRFQLRAIDQALNYSDTVEVLVRVHPPYRLIGLSGGALVALAGLLISGAFAVRRRRERDLARSERDDVRERMLQEMEEELKTAHDLQMGLMPAESPPVPGLSIAARCVSANEVGGDFYQYFGRGDGLTICLADVTGHAMEAAVPAVMFSGILAKQMEMPASLEEHFVSLNRSMCRSRRGHTFVCLSMAALDCSTRQMQLSNCGCPYPLHYRAATGQIAEVELDAYPLGVRPDTRYRSTEISLDEGDYLVLHSDGFSEATAAQQKVFGFDRTTEVIRQGCSEGLSPEALIERLLAEVKEFVGHEPQADDMTCVVVRVDA